MSSPIEEIKSRIDLVELVQSYLRLAKAGMNYKALCPFHAEKTPSFFVSPSRQIWHCFGGCGKGGDIFKFVMEIEACDFPEALRLLASRAGVVLQREDPRVRSERNRLYDLCETATLAFERSLALTPAVKAYLKNRGIAEETVGAFRIGFAPERWDFLLKTLATQGFKPDEMGKAGLAIRSEDNSSWYDRFRNRIIFPIPDANDRVIGFGGRIFRADPRESASIHGKPASAKATADTAKYINTPQTAIYDKSRVLYGFDKAKQEIRSQNQVVVVEGYMDCVLSHQAGVTNTVAVSGTALTPPQLKTLRRLCERLVSSFDTDAAGDSATRRSLSLATQEGFETRIAAIPSGKDPADAVRENPAAWAEAVSRAKPVVEFYLEKLFREKDPRDVSQKKEIAATLLPLIAELPNEIEKAHWMSEFSRRLGVNEEVIRKEIQRLRSTTPLPPEIAPSEPSRLPARRDLLEERLLALLCFVPAELYAPELASHHLSFRSALHAELFEGLARGEAVPSRPDLREALELLRFKGEVLASMSENLGHEFVICKRELEKECLREELLKLGTEIESRERTGDQAGVAMLLQNFRELSDTLQRLG